MSIVSVASRNYNVRKCHLKSDYMRLYVLICVYIVMPEKQLSEAVLRIKRIRQITVLEA